MKSLRCSVLVLLVSVFVACQPAANVTEATEPDVNTTSTTEIARASHIKAINDLLGRYIQAYTNEDPDLFVSLFTADAIRMPPDAEIFRGRPRIRLGIEAEFAQSDTDVVLHVQESEFSGDLAFVRGDWAVVTTPEGGGESTEIVGKWMCLMEQQADGSWLIARNIWNLDAPLT